MPEYQIPKTPSAYEFPLLIRHLLSRLSAQHTEQQIVYGDRRRFSYVGVLRHINDTEIVGQERYAQAAIGDGYKKKLREGRGPRYANPRRIVSGCTHNGNSTLKNCHQ